MLFDALLSGAGLASEKLLTTDQRPKTVIWPLGALFAWEAG